MTRLFWKIFLWFWGSMVLIGLALYFVVLTARPEVLPKAWRETVSSSVAIVGASAVNTYEHQGSKALASALALAGQRSQSRYWLYSATEKELSNLPDFHPEGPPRSFFLFPINPDGMGDGGGGPRDGNDRQDGPDGKDSPDSKDVPGGNDRPEVKSSVDRDTGRNDFNRRGRRRGPPLFRAVRAAFQTDEPQFVVMGPDVIVARRVKSSGEKTYVVAAWTRRPDFGRPASDQQVQIIGGVVILLLSAGICFGLVRYLTSPLIVLRQATHRLAGGDLGARTHAAEKGRRDEVADLGRDFDTMAERLEALVGSQRRLLGDISHELRSPLARLNMALALSRRQASSLEGGDSLAPSHDRISREAKRLESMIGQLLDLTRLESGEVEAGEAVHLDQVVREVVADAHYEAEANGKAVKLVTSAPFVLNGDLDLLRSAVENVVRNAVRYTAEGTAVEVTLSVGSEAVIRVRDHGPGVPEEALSQLFTPFYRVETARDRNSGGVGLGLSITQRAVQAHGGHVEAENAPEGGLTLILTLPQTPEIL